MGVSADSDRLMEASTATVASVTVRLIVDERAWRDHVMGVVDCVKGLTPVVKGNGYGFGRSWLAEEAAVIAREIAVGTVHEAAGGMTGPLDALTVLTPAGVLPALWPEVLPAATVLTVGHPRHVDVLRVNNWKGRVYIKLASSMQRYGVSPDRLDALLAHVHDAGLDVYGFMFHPPLIGGEHTEADTLDEITTWLDRLDPQLPLSLSHVSVNAYERLQREHPHRTFRLRLGTALWHGDKSFLRLSADVLDVRDVQGPALAGYHHSRIVDGATIVMIGAGTTHGVAPLADGRSPFHFQHKRLTLLESPHMHTSMALAGRHEAAPQIGDWVDVQRPLITTTVDEIVWA